MEWLWAGYAIGFVITAGMALANEVNEGRQLSVPHMFFCGAVWPIIWVGVVAYAFLWSDQK